MSNKKSRQQKLQAAYARANSEPKAKRKRKRFNLGTFSFRSWAEQKPDGTWNPKLNRDVFRNPRPQPYTKDASVALLIEEEVLTNEQDETESTD
jgi:hypothetical protein